MTGWNDARAARAARLAAAAPLARRKRVAARDATALLEAVLRPGDRVCIEGDNQKQADLLAAALAAVDSAKVHDLHMVQSGVVLPEHLDVFERGIAKRLDYAYSGPQSQRIAKLLFGGKIELGAVHTYLELFARYFIDLTPHVALVAAVSADADGNLYTGPNTEDTPTVVEATAFKDGIVIAQVEKIVDRVPRVDIPGDRVHFVVEAGRPFYVEPLFTRDPAGITETQILTAMLAIKGIYARYGVKRLNHGIGFNTAAIELLLPTYGERLGLKGRVCTHWALNPHPTLIPAIESGWVEQIHCFGSEVGMDDYIRARSDIFFTGADGSLRSNRAFCQTAGLYACDMFIGSTLQIDLAGHSSTVTAERIAGFGGAPNMGSDARGRRHPSEPWIKAGEEADPATPAALRRGRKLVVQIGETFGEKNAPMFVEKLDALRLADKLALDLAPVMVYGDDVTHVVTEEGIANLLMCRDADEREHAIRGVAGYTEIGRGRDRRLVERLRERGVIRRPEDLGIDPLDADRRLLAARSIKDLVHWSAGLYAPPARFRNW
ncbi:malonate decarboxylase subunit alpha [Burkholderia thailandensis]|uniref:malonate decarboxylase subunit alpha n=1 Tax=Burkholderia thailandensis TaxID=57975 RepID=UPI0005D853BA|nr:malonate decarboxylase subunit alpha [Burkholderia thailandensis]AJY28773.1 malonate decarboxylase, alpha subunit [Burkholderia thailandensis 34]AOJ56426.1 malonate decarboxylase subunit alpha [Burkholderia thailandensis]KXF62170.1 malonate decarboxylase subunit alpha [Burkholderia thailandensis]MCZ2901322.1 malonate decarboxylase subunit alpha [Burkholderia thailandensis]MDD1482250.1 malonate decarboxylase subunit alpha [Burkholderia thailandensis]